MLYYLLHFEGLGSGEGVVARSQHVAVAHSFAFEIGREISGELLELSELLAELKAFGVHHDVEQRLSAARIVDHLLGKVDIRILHTMGAGLVRLRHFLRPLEEEDETIHWRQTCERIASVPSEQVCFKRQ